MNEWCIAVESYLDENGQRLSWDTLDAGPDTEIEFWKKRQQKLLEVIHHLETQACRFVVGCLTAVSRQAPDKLVVDSRDRLMDLLEQWKGLEEKVDDAYNEAKDNMKYLATLDRFMLDLYSPDPAQILECLPGLINALKMIHTISGHFNTSKRMTRLFSKISNQMIATCLMALNGKDAAHKIWEVDPQTLVAILESCLRLNETYQDLFHQTKERLSTMTSSRQFDFDEHAIFGKFDLFSRRAIKLLDLFSTMHQYGSLRELRLVNGSETLVRNFDEAVKQLKSKGHDVLEYQNDAFDR